MASEATRSGDGLLRRNWHVTYRVGPQELALALCASEALWKPGMRLPPHNRAGIEKLARTLYREHGDCCADGWGEHLAEADREELTAWARGLVVRHFPELVNDELRALWGDERAVPVPDEEFHYLSD